MREAMHSISELRQDLVTGDWVVVATGRAKRPNEFAKHQIPSPSQPKEGCPFEEILDPVLLVYDRMGRALPIESPGIEWWLQIVPNKYAAFGHGTCAEVHKAGPYHWEDGAGFHEVVITRDHTRSISAMDTEEVSVILRAYRDRYRMLKDDVCVKFVSIFHNHGREAGATVSHPHSQIIAIPVIPPDVSRSLEGSAAYYKKRKACVHCAILEFETGEKTRILYENSDFVVLCPYASRQAFQIQIFPLRHTPAFETIEDSDLGAAGEALRTALAKLDRGLGNPAYNFFIHTAPTAADGENYHHYHWHIEIVPKTAIWAGFEIGTGIEISTTSPEAAAGFLRAIPV